MTDRASANIAAQYRLGVVAVTIITAVAWMWFARQFDPDAALMVIVASVAGIAVAIYWALHRLATASAFVVACLISGCVLLPHGPIGWMHASARDGQCSMNVRQISMALQAYHDAHGSFPPAYTTDKNGKPLHSWRVLILPFLDEQDLYAQFNLEEPWDSQHNQQVARRTPIAFRCPMNWKEHPGGTAVTQYVAVTGKNTMWPGAEAVKLSEVTSDPNRTIMVVEWPSSNIAWNEPVDVPLSELRSLTELLPGYSNGTRYYHSQYVAMASGNVEHLDLADVPVNERQTLFLRTGKEATNTPLN